MPRVFLGPPLRAACIFGPSSACRVSSLSCRANPFLTSFASVRDHVVMLSVSVSVAEKRYFWQRLICDRNGEAIHTSLLIFMTIHVKRILKLKFNEPIQKPRVVRYVHLFLFNVGNISRFQKLKHVMLYFRIQFS